MLACKQRISKRPTWREKERELGVLGGEEGRGSFLAGKFLRELRAVGSRELRLRSIPRSSRDIVCLPRKFSAEAEDTIELHELRRTEGRIDAVLIRPVLLIR